jgi:hypothetical protein
VFHFLPAIHNFIALAPTSSELLDYIAFRAIGNAINKASTVKRSYTSYDNKNWPVEVVDCQVEQYALILTQP